MIGYMCYYTGKYIVYNTTVYASAISNTQWCSVNTLSQQPQHSNFPNKIQRSATLQVANYIVNFFFKI